ncbi:MAG TPA: aminomethyl-transferring glycine dehydrogenase subunit GcvPA [Petrotogaceae bacterium]|jgi:glycine dehydrogenase subunit 1|nr:aminomethyl-transferring glycine dehydrogenase subunit GcvPA [Petrotogaceae bacterium]HOG34217.1 aminomethyl-transferring glycine dehydrogenase subunit GcvPA [Petrotogaceae bacterium]HQC39715.1 aminomethyl-transferring glycine dehydrogenase subunit GcvPA [Petrotogaceae bacterium]
MDYPFLPHTEEEIGQMLESIGLKQIDDLYSDVPVLLKEELSIAPSKSEMQVREIMKELSCRNISLDDYGIFRGAGVYNHYIPSAVYQLASKRGFLTAYTPYQAEVSQGTLQMLFEYQTMICEITGMEVANSSMYDGASAMAESVLMAQRVTKKDKVLICDTVHPEYIQVTRTYTEPVNTVLELLKHDSKTGQADLQDLKAKIDDSTAAVVVQYTNFYGVIEDIKTLRENIPSHILLIVVANPISLGMLQAPGKLGADIVVGEGQCLGNNCNFGGPGFGFFASKHSYIRQMPGRIIGETLDREGKRGFVMVLQTREQHIRREKATSNICSNQAHNTLIASIYLSFLGKSGLKEVAYQCYHKAHYLAEKLMESEKFEPVFSGPFFNEFVLKSSVPVGIMNQKLLEQKYIGPLNLEKVTGRDKDCALFCATEMTKKEEIDYITSFLEAMI